MTPPTYLLLDTLSTGQRGGMVRGSHEAQRAVQTDFMAPVRVLFETRIEVRIEPTRDGLPGRIIYHHHPSLFAEGEVVFANSLTAWSDIFSHLSHHARLREICSRQTSGTQSPQDAILISAANLRGTWLSGPGRMIEITRSHSKGLAVNHHQDEMRSVAAYIGRQDAAEDVHAALRVEVSRANAALEALSLPKRLWIEAVLFAGLLYVPAENRTISFLRRHWPRFSKSKDPP